MCMVLYAQPLPRMPDWPVPTQLEGPGMPVTCSLLMFLSQQLNTAETASMVVAASRVKEKNSHGGKRKSNATQSGRKATANGTWTRRGEQWPGKCSYNFMSLHTSPFLH